MFATSAQIRWKWVQAGHILAGMRCGAVILLSLSFLAMADDDPAGVLIRLRDQVLAHAQQIPNHTCVESVRRDRYERVREPAPRSCDALLARRKLPGFSSSLRLATTDRLRLDVLLSTERELYSWAGAKRFEEGEVDELVTQGAFATGPFASMLLSVLASRDARFIFEGDTSLGGRRLLEYSYNVLTLAINYLTHQCASARQPSQSRRRRPNGRGRLVARHDVGCGGY